MSLSSSFLSEDQFCCSICLDVFSDPVSTPCGHSFCLRCISSYWDSSSSAGGGGATGGGGGAGQKGASPACVCPLCKENFRKRPELHVNRTLREITEQFKLMVEAGGLDDDGGGAGEEGGGGGGGGETGTGVGGRFPPQPQPQPPPVPPRPRGGEMPGSVIAEMKHRFRRPPPPPPTQHTHTHTHTQTHTQTHTHTPPLAPPPQQRRLSANGPPPADSSSSASDAPLCPAHRRALDYFCRTDGACVCAACLETPEHRGHTATPAKREWLIKKSQLGITEVELRTLISERERKIEEVKTSMEDIQAHAEREVSGGVALFSCLAASVERCRAALEEAVEAERRAALGRAQGLVQELEAELERLRGRSRALTRLAQSNDYVLFLQTFPALSSPPQTRDWSDAAVTSQLSSGVVLRTVNQTVERLQEELRRLPETCLLPPSHQTPSRYNPRVRSVQEYGDDVILDPVTAHPRLLVSGDGKQVRCCDRYQPVPDGPERFDRVVCVLGLPGFSSGRHYWEVEVGGKTDWDLGVASRSINRKGKITVSPAHGYYFLSLRDGADYAFRTDPSTALGGLGGRRPNRVGVYLDYDEARLSFYDAEARALIYTFAAADRFPDAVHPFFSPCTNKSGCNEAPLVICPVAVPD